MSTRHRAVALVLLVSLLAIACGPAEPTATPVPATATRIALAATQPPAPPTATPVPPTDTPVSPSATPVPPTDTPVPPTVTPPPPTRTPRPTPTPRPPLTGSGGGVLAFVRTRESGWGIYVMNADGSQQRRILFHGQALAYPDWSPDGSQIAFHKHQSDDVVSIHVMDADGDNERRLTQTETYDAAPVWSPDGKQIAFTRDEDIWVMNADGSDPRLLMDDPVAANGADWSPDGSQIVFESGRHGNTEIYVVGSDGSALRRLTDNEAEDWWPTWSPDGSQIAFMSTLDGDWEIYVMDANGGNLRQLTENSVDDRGPAWSPDGTRIAFVSNRDSGLPNDTEIYVMNADGTDQRRITEKSGFEWGVDWRPDSSPETSQAEPAAAAPSDDVEGLRITILYDNDVYDKRLTPEWGFAALVEYGDHVLLFDTGGTPTLVDNMHLLGIDPETIEAVVLSHEHPDHIGGLVPLLAEANQPTVYLLASFPADFRNAVAALTDVVEVSRKMEIYPDIYTTGEVIGDVREQALAIRTDEGTVIITGCAHPGIGRMVRRGRSSLQPGVDVEYAPVALVVGGFHLAVEDPDVIEGVIADLLSLNVRQVCATHCTGDVAIPMFAEAFGDRFIPGGAGKVITLP
jgi:Tol biopolymer transport system component/metal-dependent hydrolase (beta-lactamase superfamily II)